MDYYEILGMPRDASPREIRSAFRRLARSAHPDVSGNPDAARFRGIETAYAVLSDSRKRDAYDRSLNRHVPVRAVSNRRRPPEAVYKVFPGRRDPFSRIEEIYSTDPGTPDDFDHFAAWILSFFSRHS